MDTKGYMHALQRTLVLIMKQSTNSRTQNEAHHMLNKCFSYSWHLSNFLGKEKVFFGIFSYHAYPFFDRII